MQNKGRRTGISVVDSVSEVCRIAPTLPMWIPVWVRTWRWLATPMVFVGRPQWCGRFVGKAMGQPKARIGIGGGCRVELKTALHGRKPVARCRIMSRFVRMESFEKRPLGDFMFCCWLVLLRRAIISPEIWKRSAVHRPDPEAEARHVPEMSKKYKSCDKRPSFLLHKAVIT